jgi:hypothetical protein
MDNDVLKAATDGFSLPHDVVMLPTKGIFYNNKKNSVKVGYLTASDENFLLNNDRRDNIIMTLLRNKIYEHELRPDELLDSDVEAILIFLRNSSFGPEYTLNLTDPVSGKQFEHTEILDELRVNDTEHKPDNNGCFVVKLPKTGSTVKIKPITFFEGLELDEMAENYPKGRVAPIITWRLNKMVLEVDGSDDRNMISQFIEHLPIMDSKFIRNFIKNNVPSLNLSREVNAPSGEKVAFNVSFGVSFFRPFF